MLMGPSSVHKARGIKDCLNTFLEASGLEIIKEKSQTYFFNTPRITKWKILRILEFHEGIFPSKYLGALMEESTINQVSWKELLKKLTKSWAFGPSEPLIFQVDLSWWNLSCRRCQCTSFQFWQPRKPSSNKLGTFRDNSYGRELKISKNGLWWTRKPSALRRA